MVLPQTFEDKMRELLKEEYEAYTACFEEPRHYGLRVNTSKISAEEFRRICPFKITPVPWIKNGFYYDGEQVSPAKHPYYFAGLYYLQEPSAMTPADRLPVEPGDKVLDLCAAPGGKATELGAKLRGSGLLAANDISSSRAKGLLKNIELFGIGNVLVLSEEPGRLTTYFPEYFDKILIDAPCSGEGMFRKEKKMVKAWEEHGPEFFSNIQRNLITQAAQMLKPGGMMLYSTCTFDGRENEEIIGHLLDACPEFEISDIVPYEGFCKGKPELAGSDSGDFCRTVRIFPHKMKGEGHFLALLKKSAAPESAQGLHAQNSKAKEVADAKTAAGNCLYGRTGRLPEELLFFLEDVCWEIDPARVDIRGERVYYMPEGLPALRGVRFLRTGLFLGEWKKKRFEPSQALAMALKKEEYKKIIDFSAGDERTARYLKGETLDVKDMIEDKPHNKKKDKERSKHGGKNWYLVCVDGYPLGWGKLTEETLKNKYLPGWRLC